MRDVVKTVIYCILQVNNINFIVITYIFDPASFYHDDPRASPKQSFTLVAFTN